LFFNACGVCGNTCGACYDDMVQGDLAAEAAHLNEYAAKADAAVLPEVPADVVAVVAIVLWPG
jgi:hypothetical protein